MDLFYDAVGQILDLFKYKYDKKIIQSGIMDAYIVLIWKNHELSHRYLKELYNNDINTKDFQKIIYILQSKLSKKYFDDLYYIPTAYEFIISNDINKEKYSIYYTPKWIVKYMVANSVNAYIKTKKDLSSLKILEPSCGCGTFLLYVFDVLYEWYIQNTKLTKEHIVKEIMEKILYATDIDEVAVKYCKYMLMIKIMELLNKERFDINLNIYSYDYLKENNIDKIKFDVIIGNPPYLENRKINKYYDKEYLKSKYTTASGRFDIYSLFIEKALNMMKYEGKLSFIVPGSLLTNNNFILIRKILLDKTEIIEIIKLGDKIFNNVGMDMIIITVDKKKSINTNHEIQCKELHYNHEKDLYKKEYRYIPQKYYYNLLNYVFDIGSTNITFKMREKVYKSTQLYLNDRCEVIAGIATGNIRNKLLTRNENDMNTKKVLEGKNVFSYYYQWGGLYIKDDKSLINRDKGEYATFMRKEFIYNEKILIRQTADRFICAYDDE
ncbi:HsdM family class I SAM-dependent methyltransferase, partial [Caldisalinibacter kiritimatiensis]|uniref:HsdM family class I SAM-dependent methyltransferase n=1 Tax=Caldisalinibacter kiritimatiensis TaxID=1304284 RepID=UPI000551149B